MTGYLNTLLEKRTAPYWLLIALCLMLYLPGFFTLPPFDRDESRFAQASHQMIESGDEVDIRFQNETRYKKPIGIYWAQVASVKIFGENWDNPIWPYRIPSLLGAIASVLLTFALGRKFFDTRTAFIAATLLASCVLLGMEARLAKTDAALFGVVCLAQFSLAHIWLKLKNNLKPGWRSQGLFWLALGVGILIKGPIILLVTGATIIALCITEKQWRWLKYLNPLLGIIIVAAIVAPWLIAIYIKTNGAFFTESIGHDLLDKVAGAQESHGAPPGTYLVSSLLTFWPGILLVLFAVPYVWQNRRDDKIRFLLCWLIPTWIIFELMPTKLVHYVLPVFPVLALLAAKSFVDQQLVKKDWVKIILSLLWVAAGVALAFAFVFVSSLVWDSVNVPGLVAGFMALVVIMLGLFAVRTGRFYFYAKPLLVALLCMYLAVFQFLLPGLQTPWVGRSLKEKLVELKLDTPPKDILLVGYSEPSAVFSLGTDIQLVNAVQAAHYIEENPKALAIVNEDNRKEFLETFHKHSPQAFDKIEGFNYSRGKPVTLHFYRMKP